MEKLFILTRGRTGSTAVVDALGKCDGVLTAQELFLAIAKRFPSNSYPVVPHWNFYRETQSPAARAIFGMLPQRLHVDAYLAYAERFAATHEPRVFGFKVLENHFGEVPSLKKRLRARGYRAIYLRRAPGPRLVSLLVAGARGKFNTTDRHEHTQVRIDTATLDKLLQAETGLPERDMDELRDAGIDVLEARYEDFLASRTDFFRPIFDYLGLPAQDVPQSDYRIMIRSPAEEIENFDEVQEVLARHGASVEG